MMEFKQLFTQLHETRKAFAAEGEEDSFAILFEESSNKNVTNLFY